MNLMKAARQWSERPDDERFESLDLLLADRTHLRDCSSEKRLVLDRSTIVENAGEVCLVGTSGVSARLTHHAFGQLAQRASAPAGYLRGLPAPLAASCLAEGLKARVESGNEDRGLFYANGCGPFVRALTSDKYARVWDASIVERVVDLQSAGWRVPPARPVRAGQKGTRTATQADVLAYGSHASLGIKVGDPIAPAGLYASDHDLFVFMVDNARTIRTPSGDLSRGFFAWNSEVGAASFGIMTFLFDAVCGNHIVWGASNVREIRVRHVGQALNRSFRAVSMQLREYSNASATEEEEKIERMTTRILGAKKEDVVSAIFGKKLPGLTRGILETAYETAARTPRYGNPNTVWGMVCGLTEASQGAYADARNAIDVSAGKLIDVF
jgi:hypothetical protein